MHGMAWFEGRESERIEEGVGGWLRDGTRVYGGSSDGQNASCMWTIFVQFPHFLWLLCMAYEGGLSNGK